MDKWIELRRKIRNQEIPLRQISRESGIHRQTLRKIRDHSQPPGYQRAQPIQKSKIDPYIDRIKAILEDDKGADHKKQYHTAKKIWEILQSEGSTSGWPMSEADLIFNPGKAGEQKLFCCRLLNSKKPKKGKPNYEYQNYSSR
jgi:hypothetical protein